MTTCKDINWTNFFVFGIVESIRRYESGTIGALLIPASFNSSVKMPISLFYSVLSMIRNGPKTRHFSRPLWLTKSHNSLNKNMWMCVGSNMKVATHTAKPTSRRSKLYHKRLLVLKLVVHDKKRKYIRGIGTRILLKSKAKRWPISVISPIRGMNINWMDPSIIYCFIRNNLLITFA